MWDQFIYYVDLFAELCGFDGSDNDYLFGWFVVAIAAALVIYAFYEAITKAIWPGEQESTHIKYQILDDL